MKKTKILSLFSGFAIAVAGITSAFCLRSKNASSVNASSDQTYILVGSMNSWNNSDTTYQLKWSSSQYEIKDVELSAGTSFRVTKCGQWIDWAGWSQLRGDAKSNFEDAGNDNNIKVKNASRFNFYFKDWEDSGTWNPIYVSITGYSVKLHKDGGTGTDLTSYKYGESKVLPTLTKEDCAFVGWYDNKDFTGDPVSSITSTDHGDKEYWAKFVYNTPLHSVTYVANGGTSVLPIQNDVHEKESFIIADAMTREFYTFAGWSDGTNIYQPNEKYTMSTSDVVLTAQWNNVKGRYLTGKFGDCSWGIEGAVYMEHKNDQYEATIELEYGDVVKCAYYDGEKLTSYYGFDSILVSCGAFYCVGDDGDNHNIKCYATGSYNFYFSDTGWDGKKISIEVDGDLSAQHLAAKLMSFDSTPNTCTDRFPVCKTMYLGLTIEEQTKFKSYETSEEDQFKNAYDRYVAWATALNANPWSEDSSSARNILSPIMESSSATWIIVAISLAGLTAIGGFFYYKKRKQY